MVRIRKALSGGCVFLGVLAVTAAAPAALEVGQTAPTFKLKSLDGKSETDLASFKGKRPVILFFGSYT